VAYESGGGGGGNPGARTGAGAVGMKSPDTRPGPGGDTDPRIWGGENGVHRGDDYYSPVSCSSSISVATTTEAFSASPTGSRLRYSPSPSLYLGAGPAKALSYCGAEAG
ncbi:unnamed protein product, partial [Discosporangium mesarthrocarpum]